MAVESTENDTLDSLYSSYSAISFDRSSASHSTNNMNLSLGQPDLSALSNSSTPLSSLRERVFTPPPVPGPSGTVAADSPNSSSSPITSIDSISMGRNSPFSDRPQHSSRSDSPSGQDVELSRKIPFGFRSSFALGRANKSTLMSTRNSGRSIPASPLQTHPEIPGSEPEDSGSNPPPSSSSTVSQGLKPLRLSTLFDAKYNSRPKNQSRMSSSSVKSANSSRLSGTSSLYEIRAQKSRLRLFFTQEISIAHLFHLQVYHLSIRYLIIVYFPQHVHHLCLRIFVIVYYLRNILKRLLHQLFPAVLLILMPLLNLHPFRPGEGL
ncbi:hypothetical protein BJ912DRAFT_78722 [Pholiota molesta]|nr:hypothetical protein BJ912DRAFT_78722 [Pholiota molesta]